MCSTFEHQIVFENVLIISSAAPCWAVNLASQIWTELERRPLALAFLYSHKHLTWT